MAKKPKKSLEITPPGRPAIRRRLLSWYDRHKRDLPWRRRQQDAYAQLLAEFMLQQTQVSTVIGYYQRFLERFPDVAALAAANVDEVLALWSGLGYYSRARHLHQAAQEIVRRFGGVVPKEVDELMTLPGIGRYTAGAIASVAYDTRAPVLDGNVMRVLMRVLAMEGDAKSAEVRESLWAVADSLIPRRRCGDFNQALMELGATVCLPRSPHCLLCPIRSHCRAREEGSTGRIPAIAQRPRVESMNMVTAAVHLGPKLLFVQRPMKGLWGGLWELPSEVRQEDETVNEAWGRLRRRLPKCAWQTEPLAPMTRVLTHRKITFHVYKGAIAASRPPAKNGSRWLEAAELDSLGLSRACQTILIALDWL